MGSDTPLTRANPERMGHYLVLEPLHAPAGQARYLAEAEAEPGEFVVLSCLAEPLSLDVESGITLRERAAIEARLTHPAVVPVRELGDLNGHHFVAREHFRALAVSALACPSPEIAATIVFQVLDVGWSAHASGLVHGRISSESVLVDDAGEVWVTGFAEGSLIPMDLARAEDKSLAPEVRQGDAPTASADVYAIGVLFWRLLIGGEHPDEWEPAWSAMMMHLASAGVPGDALGDVQRFLQRSLAERPSQRFHTIAAQRAAFESVAMELDAPKPTRVVANAFRAAFDAAFEVDGTKISMPSEDSDSAPRGLADVGGPADVIVLPAHNMTTTPGVDRNKSWPAFTPVSATTEGSAKGPSTRLMGGKKQGSGSLRSLSADLRNEIAPHPLEILARSRYQVLSKLGEGGTGAVYKAEDATLNELLALKTLRFELTNDAGWLQRFKRELKVTRDLEHPHILPAYHLEHLDGLYFFTMKFVDGDTLYDIAKKRGKLAVDEVVSWMLPIASALQCAHENGVIHRDLKSANVMLEYATDQTYLMDFGIASVPDSLNLTMTGQGIGTPLYMAPEQAMGGDVGPTADVYAFGVVLYELLTGELPFGGHTTVAVYTNQIQRNYRRLTASDGLTPGLIALIDSCLSPAPEERPASMLEVAEALKG